MSKFLKIGCLTLFLIFFIGMTFVAGLGIGAIGAANTESSLSKLHKKVIEGSSDDEIAIFSLNGVILSNPTDDPFSLAGGFITPGPVGETLSLARDDADIKAIIIQIDSPGGSAVASDEIYQYIRRTAAKKPVVILMKDVAASGGYFIASAGSYIFANPATLTGSIGVITEITDVQDLLKKIGVEQETYKSGTFKDLLSSTRSRTPEEKQMIQKLLDTTYGLFLSRVAEGRKMDLSRVSELADGKIYSGQDAQYLGLIDELGYRGDAVNKAMELAGIREAKLVSISTESFFESLFSQVRTKNPLSVLLPDFFLARPGVKFLMTN